MRNAGLEEAQAGIKIAGRNINNLRYADDTIFMAESEEELKSLLMNQLRSGLPFGPRSQASLQKAQQEPQGSSPFLILIKTSNTRLE